MITVPLDYGPVRKLPCLPRERATRYQHVGVPYLHVAPGKLMLACYAFEAGYALRALGFHVSDPATHPNGSGCVPLVVYHPLPRPLPATIEVQSLLDCPSIP
jgi:hypothetical protein